MARERHVFPTTEIAHLWAARLGGAPDGAERTDARNPQHNFWFRDDSIYSYATRIARIVTRDDIAARDESTGARQVQTITAALITTSTYSHTTAGHLSQVRRAVSHMPLFTVPDLDARMGLGIQSTAHFDNLKHYRKSVETLEGQVKRARSNKAWRERELLDMKAEANAYCRFFRLGEMFDAAKLEKEQARRKREQARRDAQWKREAEAQAAKARIDGALAADAWKRGDATFIDGDGDSCDVRRAMYGYPDTLLRLDFYAGDNGEVETSRGARVPLDDALRLYRALQRHEAKAGDRVGPYRFGSEDAAGIHIGCHFITLAEVARFAGVMGWDTGAVMANADITTTMVVDA